MAELTPDSARILAEAVLQTKKEMKELYQLGQLYNKTIGQSADAATKYNRQLGSQRGLVTIIANKAKLHRDENGKIIAQSEKQIALAKVLTDYEDGINDLADERNRAQANYILQQQMLKTGLTGAYAEQAKNLAILVETGMLTKEGYLRRIQTLKAQQKETDHLNEQADLNREIAATLLEIREETEKYTKGLGKALATARAIGNDPKVLGAFLLGQAVDKAGELVESFEHFHHLGLTAGQSIDAMQKSFSLMSMVGLADNAGVIEGMVQSYGSMNALTNDQIDTVGALAHKMGVAGQEAFAMVDAFSKMPGETAESAINAAEFTKHLATANGIAPGAVTKEIAQNSEAMALFSAGGAKGFAKAAIETKKLGVELTTAVSMSKGLLDFENSINKQMEASVLLGKEINLDKARELALSGKLEEATKEVLKNIGSQEEFEKMNVLQKQALAEATGMTVEQLTKAIDAQEEYNKYHGEEASTWMNILGYATDYSSKVGGFFKENGLLVLTLIQLLSTKNATRLAGFVADKAIFAFDKVASLWRSADKQKEIANERALQKAKQKTAGTMKSVGKGAASSVGPLLAFGAAMLMVGAGIALAAVGLAQLVSSFKDLTGEQILGAVGAMVVVMGGFVAILYTMIPAIGALGAAGSAVAIPLLALGAAFLLMGAGIGLAALGLAQLVGSLKDVPFENLLALPLAFMGMAAGLTALTVAGYAALPILGALTMLGVVAPALSGLGDTLSGLLGGGESDTMDELLTEIRGLRSDIQKGGVVNMDGQKVGEVVALALNVTGG